MSMGTEPTHGVTTAMRSIERAFLIGVEGTTEVWLIRHADVYDGMNDFTDPPLSLLGREQAARLAARMRRVDVAAVYASPLARAQETARAFADQVTTDDRLLEARTELRDGHIEMVETPSDVVARMRQAVDSAAAAHPGRRVAMVGHGVAIVHYVTEVLQLESGTLRIFPYYTSISVVRAKDERRMVGWIGDVAHLDGGLE
jgi:2,3-bisphosphoglycerate-dependent phosphoglycerate mutase